MQKVIVDAEGKVIIPPDVLRKCGVHPGDELTLVESAEGLFVYQGGVDAKTLTWWQALNSEEKQQAAAEAQAYEQLSTAEQDELWNEAAETFDTRS
ncbi:AbrB/MazE/SpoVT family DNA-binding domain-containing protein [Candidatus Entotheonella palauensis]|uniref:AbrB/MazE/SpoVT family DNA-binding domain-containing protein n=1 Tax=Candidatus Entotheonella palauensis TaxID=93172 RepID=UPI000B7D189C|nr:AbrB/MazE/SpoVT family DNA-binding domain-containing protein [Candidatus Entotheonella palauensis]